MGNHDYAINDFNKAIEIDPLYANAHFFCGVSKLKSKKVPEAIFDFTEAQRLDESLSGV